MNLNSPLFEHTNIENRLLIAKYNNSNCCLYIFKEHDKDMTKEKIKFGHYIILMSKNG